MAIDPNEPPVRKLFGLSAIETGTTLTIAKSDMTGLMPKLENTAESMFVAIVLRVADALAVGNYINDPTGTVKIEIPNIQDVTKTEIVITLTPKNISASPLPSQLVDPNKY
jgi:hypothetical protein